MLQGRSYKLRIVAPARCIPSGGVFRCAALRIRAHTAGAVFKPTRGVLLLPLVGVVGGSSCFSIRGLKTTGGTGLRNRASSEGPGEGCALPTSDPGLRSPRFYSVVSVMKRRRGGE